MNEIILKLINGYSDSNISNERKEMLNPLIEYIQFKYNQIESIRLNFICTHNSRRSHLAQIWAQTMAFHFNVKNVSCYSGGTETTYISSNILNALDAQGFTIQKLNDGANPIYAIKFSNIEPPMICFSKTYNDDFNPGSHFAAILTCDSADENCPIVFGADGRFPLKYEDPKIYDGTDLMIEKYLERSVQIASEMFYIFSKIVVK